MAYLIDGVIPLWIDNCPVLSKELTTHPVVQAKTGNTIYRYASASTTVAEKAAETAGRAFQDWRQAGVGEKRRLLNKVADILQRDMDQFVKIECDETSGTPEWVKEDLMATIGVLREAAAVTSQVQGAIPQVDKPDVIGFIFKIPVGPVVIIPPWNAAYTLATRAIATAVAAGCTVVLKGSETCPGTHLALARCFTEAGAPPGLLNMVVASREDAEMCTETLFASRAIRKIDFIGSATVGRILGAQASKYLKPITLELGGKCPAIVLADADLHQAAILCADGAMRHHGQVCFSTERVIVQAEVAEKFIHLLTEQVENYATSGTAVSKSVAAHARALLLDAKDKGCEFACGGTEFIDGVHEASLTPTLVLQPRNGARIIDEETFGPSLSVYVVPSPDAAVDLANDSAYGLNAAIHTADLALALSMSERLEYGQVHFNTSTLFVGPYATQGGCKGSGWGRQNSKKGVEEFLEEKFVSWRVPGSTSALQFH